MDPKHSHGPDRLDYEETSDLTEVHAAIQREHPEPTADVTPIPLWLTAVCGVAILGAGFYLGTFHGGFRGDVFNAADSSARMFVPATVKAGGATAAAAAGPTLAEQGKSVYGNCQPCHQASGQGVAGQFPTLAGTEYVASEKRIIAILLKGIQGVIKVGGAQYNGAMPAWEKTLSDKKIAAVATYVRSSFGNKYPEISDAKVAAARKEFAAQAQPWTEAQLLEIPADATFPDAAGAIPTPATAAAPAAANPVLPAGAAAVPPSVAGAAPAPSASAPAPAAASAPASASGPTPELMALGKSQYMTCMPCHQPTGMGLPPVFPPLGGSEYVNGDPKRMIAIILKGAMGPITVKGAQFNNVMPGQGMTMKDGQIAAVATYVRNSFGNSASPVSAELVAQVRKEHAARMNPWTEAELKSYGGGTAPDGGASASPAAGAPPAAPTASPATPTPQSAAPIPSPNPAAPAPGSTPSAHAPNPDSPAPAAPAPSTPAVASPASQPPAPGATPAP